MTPTPPATRKDCSKALLTVIHLPFGLLPLYRINKGQDQKELHLILCRLLLWRRERGEDSRFLQYFLQLARLVHCNVNAEK